MSVNDYREDYIEKKKKKKRTPCFFEDLYFSRYFLSLSFFPSLSLFLSPNYKQLRIKHHPIIDWQIYRSIIRAPILYILEFCFEFKKKKRRTRLVKKKRKHFSRQNKEFFFFFKEYLIQAIIEIENIDTDIAVQFSHGLENRFIWSTDLISAEISVNKGYSNLYVILYH